MKITCESFLQQVVPFLEGELSIFQSDAMAGHLESCPSCAECAASLDDIHLTPEQDILGRQTGQQELQPDFWEKMNGVLEAELEKQFENNDTVPISVNTNQKEGEGKQREGKQREGKQREGKQREGKPSMFLISQNEEPISQNTSSLNTQDSIETQNTLQLNIIPNSNSRSYFEQDPKQQFQGKSRRKTDAKRFTFEFRELVLAALCLMFLLWGYQQHQQNMILQQQIQIQNIELQHMRISLEQRPTSPKSFQEPYAIPANYIPNRIDL